MKKFAPPLLLPAPELPSHLPEKAQWLAGEGCGSWFVIEPDLNGYNISRYSPEGELECGGVFVSDSGVHLEPSLPYQVTYLSHCSQVTVIQNGELIRLRKKFIT